MTKKDIKYYLQEARNKGWWIACLYWEMKLAALLKAEGKEGRNENHENNYLCKK